jgi:putative lipoprotein
LQFFHNLPPLWLLQWEANMRKAVAGKLAGLVFSLFLAAMTGPAIAQTATLTGEVTYRERIALPQGSSLRVKLIDLTAPGTPTRVEAEAAIADPGQVPLTFTLNFEAGVVQPDHQHALIAEISAGLQLWFRNAAPYAVNPQAPEGPILIVTNFVGRLIEPEPPADEPDEVGSVPSILDVTWRAEAIDGVPSQRNADSTLSIGSDKRAGGRGGCNSYFAQAEVGAESIRFSAIAATRVACVDETTTAQETAFFSALEAARFWRLDAGELLLLDADGIELVRFARSLM